MSLAMPLATAPDQAATPFFGGVEGIGVGGIGGGARDNSQAAAERVAQWSNRAYESPVAASEQANPAQAAPEPAAAPSDARREWRVRSTGALKQEVLTDADRHTAVAMHLSPLAFIWIGPFAMAIPLVLWLVRKDQSRFGDDHGRETVNFMISFVLLNIVLAVTVVGILLIPVLWVVAVVNLVRGAIVAGRNEYFRYPVNIRFL